MKWIYWDEGLRNMAKVNESKTTVIKRSQISLNPYNPKKHSDDRIRFQKSNLQKVGFLGGIVWNETTGNLVDGHRRIMAMDQIYKYDGTPETDYDVKVEAISLDPKQEKEQMTYMAVGNTEADFNLVSRYIRDIDFSNAGLSKEDFDRIDAIASSVSDSVNTPILSFDSLIEKTEEKKESLSPKEIKDKKAKSMDVAYQRQLDEDAYIMLSFSTYEALVGFCEWFGYDTESTKFVKGEDFMAKLNQ